MSDSTSPTTPGEPTEADAGRPHRYQAPVSSNMRNASKNPQGIPPNLFRSENRNPRFLPRRQENLAELSGAG